MADNDNDNDIYAVSLDRHHQILNGIILGLPPLEHETPAEKALRQQLQREVAAIRAEGGIPAMPHD